jgi:hypothetical protein
MVWDSARITANVARSHCGGDRVTAGGRGGDPHYTDTGEPPAARVIELREDGDVDSCVVITGVVRATAFRTSEPRSGRASGDDSAIQRGDLTPRQPALRKNHSRTSHNATTPHRHTPRARNSRRSRR